MCWREASCLVTQDWFMPVLPNAYICTHVPIEAQSLCRTWAFTIHCPVLLRFGGDWDFGVHWDFWKWLSINLWQRNAVVLKLWDLRNISSKQTLPYAESTVCLWKYSNSQIHRIICIGRDLRRSLFQRLAQSRVSYEVRLCCSRLYLVLKTLKFWSIRLAHPLLDWTSPVSTYAFRSHPPTMYHWEESGFISSKINC